MTRLPILSAKELYKILRRIGYVIDHQSGSHIILRNENPPHRRLSVPNHKEIARGTLRKILHETGLTLNEFNSLRK